MNLDIRPLEEREEECLQALKTIYLVQCESFEAKDGYGLCKCGCGRETTIAKYSDHRSGVKKGDPWPFLKGHMTLKKVKWVFDPLTGCWPWILSRNKAGYGTTHAHPTGCAHVWVYEIIVSTVPEGHELDHLCENKPCVNPHHLEPKLNGEHKRLHAVPRMGRDGRFLPIVVSVH